MNKLSANLVGLYTGIIISGCHAIWSVLVALNWAQGFLDWIFGLHFIEPPYIVSDFQFITAIILVFLTFFVGYVVGYLATLIWNRMVG